MHHNLEVIYIKSRSIRYLEDVIEIQLEKEQDEISSSSIYLLNTIY